VISYTVKTMNPGVAIQPINQNNDDVCEVCFEQKPVYISLITCPHRNIFCEECIKSWLLWGNFTCPKCRAVWPLNYYVSGRENNNIEGLIFYLNI
jgi:hypothetical protein